MDSPSHAHINRVLSPVSSPSTSRRFDDRDRASIISTSTKGWAPLNTKRPAGLAASVSGSPARTTTATEGPRRTSSSFKHVRQGNLVSNSIFKSASPSLGASGSSPKIPSQGRKVSTGKARKVSGPTRNVVKAGSTPRKPSLTEDMRTSNGAASPSRKPVAPGKGSTGLSGLAEGAHVSRSPFLRHTASFEGASSGSPGKLSPGKPSVRGERFPSPDRRDPSPTIIRSDAAAAAAARPAESPALSAESIAHVMHMPSQPNTTVSPGKSSLTSRRLRGPRLSDPSQTQVYGAQTFPSSGSIARRLGAAGKTVTFRDVADVKEFQADSSGAEWEDEGEYEEGESWDEVLLGPPGSGGQRAEEENHTFQDESFMENTPSPEMDLSGLKRYGSLNARPSPARSPLQRERGAAYAEQEREEEEGYAGYVAQLEQQQHRQHPPQQGYDEESTTANFIDSLYADGYLSPPGSQGGVSASGTFDGLAATLEREVGAYGVPLGRSHHADRAAEAHAVERDHHHGHVQQPALPRAHADEAVGETMLRTGDARTPATAVASREPYGEPVPAHQDGQFVDPFVTIQTATRVSAIDYHGAQPASQREEDGVPLGRTSHAERAKVARQLATRGLGLGMPARPMVPFVMGGMRGQQSESGSEDEYDDRGYSIPNLSKLVAEPEEQRHSTRQHAQPEGVSLAPLVSPFPQQMDEMNPVDQAGSISKRALPKPPKPTPVMGMPSPVEKNENQRESRPVPEERVTSPTKVFGLSLPFSLPALSSTTSPLFTSGPGFSKAASESGSEGSGDNDLYDQDEREQSLTPPPTNVFGRQPESPHHIPEFDFESPSRQNRQRQVSDDEDPTSEAFKLVEEALPKLSLDASGSEKNNVKSRLSGLFGERKDLHSSGSSSSESLNHEPAQTSVANSRVRPRISKDVIRARLEEKRSMNSLVNSKPVPGKDDDVFLSPARKTGTQDGSTLQNKWLGNVDSPVRPGLRARQDTMSAEEVLQSVPEPKSALEQLVCNFTFTEFDEFAQASSSSPERESFKLQQAAGVHVVRHATSENVLGNKVRSSQRLALSPSGLPQIEEASTPDITANEQDVTLGQELNAGGRPKRRRSMSTGDARIHAPLESSTMDNRMSLLDTFKFEDSTSILSAFEKELNERQSVKPYTVREHKTVYASADDKVKHNIAGDVDKGRAWRQLRKASDNNQYAKEIKAMKAKASNSTKSFGTIFVKVLGIESLSLPLPKEETSFCITLDNGIDYIRTPYAALKDGAKVNQEFALVEHANFEFALGVEIRRDSHINKMIQANANPPPVAFRPPAGSRASVMTETGSIQSSASRGLKSLFSSPRKMSKAPKMVVPEPVNDAASTQDNLARYFTDGDSTAGRTHIAFKPIAKNCDARLLEIRYPMFGMHHAPAPASASMPVATSTHRGARHSVQTLPRPAPPPAPVRKQVCKITLQIFRLPPLPGLTDEQLPQSIDECLRGMRHHAWHEHEYHQGVLTQRGGDCVAPRRRPFKLIGGNLVASNAVTKKTVFSIDLRKAKALVDENDGAAGAGETRKKTLEEELEAGYSKMPRSFTLRFEDGDSITFWTDTDDEKAGWMKALGSLIGKVPSNPLWAELLAARQRHLKARSASRVSLAAIANGPATDAPPVPSK